MKITIDLDATPSELREFFGLPNVGPLQDELLAQVQEKFAAGVEGFDAASLMTAGMPAHLQNLEAFQRAMWGAMRGNADASKD
jgi:hypothetical protein